MSARWWLNKPRQDFLPAALLIILALVNAPYFSGAFVPTHDTMFIFQTFHFFYSELVFHGHLAQWIPYGTYGLQSSFYQLAFLTPMSYVAALGGWLLRVSDVLLLFKISLFAEQLVFVAGLYLLSQRLFKSRGAVAMVCLGAIGGSVWYAQAFLNLRVFYLFPLAAYALLAFFAAHRAAWLWFTGILGVAWLLGTPPYFASLWLFVCASMGLALFWADKNSWRCLRSRSWEDLWPLALLIALLAIYAHNLLSVRECAIPTAAGRDPVTGKVGLQTFLTYGGRADVGAVVRSLVFGWPTHLPWGSARDNTVYVGLLGVVFFIWSVLKVRTVPFLAMLSALVALVWLSAGGWFATLMYYVFPGMAQYRHVGLVYGLVKLLLLLCAGFGWEHFWSAMGKVRSMAVVLIGMVLLIDLVAFVSVFDVRQAFRDAGWNLGTLISAGAGPAAQALWPAMFWLRAGVYAILAAAAALTALKTKRARALRIALLLGLCLDMLSYQAVGYAEAPHLAASERLLLSTLRAHELQFQAERRPEPTQARQQQAMRLITRPGAMSTYAIAYNWAQFDPCRSAFRVDWRPVGVEKLFRAMPEGSGSWSRVVGCESPKLRLVSTAVFADTEEEAAGLIQDGADLDRVVVLRGVRPAVQPLPGLETTARAEGHLNVTRFSANELVVDANVTSIDGSWLVYADAFHSGWRATVNGHPAPIAEADLAFKAVWLPEGQAHVRFFFRNGLSSILSYVIAVLGTLGGLGLLGVCWRTLFRPQVSGA